MNICSEHQVSNEQKFLNNRLMNSKLTIRTLRAEVRGQKQTSENGSLDCTFTKIVKIPNTLTITSLK